MTLVELDQPFLQMKNWMAAYLNDHHSPLDAAKFYGRFSRYRAILAAEPVFRRGIDLLVQSLEMTCDHFGIPRFADEFVSRVEEMFICPLAYPDAHTFLTEAKKSYRVGLLTNADNSILTRAIRGQGFAFDFVITSEDARCNKPRREIFEYAMRALQVDPREMVMIGNSQVDDVYGAGQLGIRTIWVNRNSERLAEGIAAPALEIKSLADLAARLPEVFETSTLT